MPPVDNLAAGEIGDVDDGLHVLHLNAGAETHLELEAAVLQDSGTVGGGREDLRLGQILRGLKAEGAQQLQRLSILSQLNRHLFGAAVKLLGSDRSAADGVLSEDGDRYVAIEHQRFVGGGAGAGNDDDGRFAGRIVARCRRITLYTGRRKEQFGIAVRLNDGKTAQVGRFGHPFASRQRGDSDVEVDIAVGYQALCRHRRAVPLHRRDRRLRADEGDAAGAMRVADRDGQVAVQVAVGDDRAVGLHLGENFAEDKQEILRTLCFPRQR